MISDVENLALQRAILDSANLSIIATDPGGTIVLFNSTAERWLGYRADEVVGKCTLERFHSGTEILAHAATLSSELGAPVKPGLESFFASARQGQVDDREWMYIRKDGTELPVRVSVTALRDREGALTGFLAVARDITHDKQAEMVMRMARNAAEQANEAKSRFLANMTHEIRTPLNGIIGVNSMLLDTPLSASQKRLTMMVQESAESLLRIVNDVLDFSKIEAGRMELEQIDFELRLLLAEVERLHGVHASMKGLRLEVDLAPGIPPVLRGDSARVGQVLNNLVTNAIKFSSRGRIRIEVAPVSELDGGKYWVRFSVTDEGIGIEAETQRHIFEAFTQADGSTTRKFGGTGLGLSICRQLVEMMGGEIGVTSARAAGSTFWFRLPFNVAISPVASLPAQEVPEPLDGVMLSGCRVLVAEDSGVNQLVILHELRSLGCEVEAVNSGMAAVEAFARKEFDLVLMDCQMPKMDGYEATARIRGMEAGRSRTPIVAVTANAVKGERERCLVAGMDDYLPKPFTKKQLRAVVVKSMPKCAAKSKAAEPAVGAEEMAALGQEAEELGGDLMAKLVEAFSTEAEEALAAMEAGARAGIPEDLRKPAHKLKGSGGNFGAHPLRRLCEQIEDALSRGDLAAAASLVPAVRKEVGRVISALRATTNAC